MDLQLQEAKQRTEVQRLVLDMRTQQLLNYTHEHVSKTSNETERRMNERMIEGIQASHGRINNELQVQTRNLQQEIQAHLRAEREQQLAEIENRLALQASHIQEAVNDSETRVRSDLQTQFNEWESNLEDTKSWTRAYLRTAMEAYDREKEAKYSVVTGTYIDQYLKRHDAEVASMISAQVRAERRKEQMKQDERVQACVDDAARAVEIRVDKRLVKVKQFQEQRFNELQSDITQKLQNAHLQASLAPQQSSASILQKVETIIDARLKAEVKNIMESQEQLIESTVARKLQDLKSSTKASTACHHGCDTLQSTDNHSPPRRTAQAKASRGGIQARKINPRSNRARKQAPKVAVNLSSASRRN